MIPVCKRLHRHSAASALSGGAPPEWGRRDRTQGVDERRHLTPGPRREASAAYWHSPALDSPRAGPPLCLITAVDARA